MHIVDHASTDIIMILCCCMINVVPTFNAYPLQKAVISIKSQLNDCITLILIS